MSNETFASYNEDELWEKQMLKDIESEKQREHALKVKAVTDFVKAYERQKFGGVVGVFFFMKEYLKELEKDKGE